MKGRSNHFVIEALVEYMTKTQKYAERGKVPNISKTHGENEQKCLKFREDFVLGKKERK